MKAGRRRWSSFFCLALLLLGGAGGCRNRDTVEMALRAREQDVMVLKEELLKQQAYNQALAQELHAVRTFGGVQVTPELASQMYGLKRITLGRGTSGRDEDKQPGDEALYVVIEPRDPDDHIIKAPGSVQVTALEVSPEGIKTPLSSWTISPEQLKQSWKQGLFSNGYSLTLPWQQPPKTTQVRVIVRFQVSDGRVFEADRDVSINPGPAAPLLPKMPPADPILFPKNTPPGLPSNAESGWPKTVEPGWPSPKEVLPLPKEQKPAPKPAPVPPVPANGPLIQPIGHWQAPSLNGAVKMLRPEPLYPAEPAGPPVPVLPQ